MRAFRTLLALSGAATLAACGGDTGPQSVGSVAPPAASPTPTHSFVSPTEPKTYQGIGGVQHYEYATRSDGAAQYGQLYAADANTVRDSGISLTYNPRDAIFEMTIKRPAGSVDVAGFRFQDPAHRTDFGGAASPQAGVPNFAASRNIQYLEAGGSSGNRLTPSSPFWSAGYGAGQSDFPVGDDNYSSNTFTLFYQKPGTTTKYVTYAGFVRNSVTAVREEPDPNTPARLIQNYSLDRAAFAFGERSPNSAVPTSGTGTFTGEMIASIAFNPMLDTDATFPTYLQWMQGNHTTSVNFANMSVSSEFTGTVFGPSRDAYTSGQTVLPGGSTFTASGIATLDMINRGGFTGSFTTARFVRPGLPDFTLVIAGSSLDGTFFGPGAEEIGGGFRIVGGTPDERIDILGAFTGKK